MRTSWLFFACVAVLWSGCQDDGASRASDAAAGDSDASSGGADAGVEDAGAQGDAGVEDAGTQGDAGVEDAGAQDDAGVNPADQATTRALGSSGTHACALRKAGLYCWGENFLGQLGDGTTTDSETPVAASVAGTDVVDVAVATGRTCVRRSTGQVACWGANDSGQIGDGTRKDALTAVEVPGVADATHLLVAVQSTCVVRKDGSVACWGNLPEGASGGSLTPTPVAGLSQVVELVTAGSTGYCARSKDRSVRCFRFEDDAWTAPMEVAELKGARSIAMSNTQMVCAAMPDVGIVCRDLERGAMATLTNSVGYARLSGLNLVVCGLEAAGKGRCWNVVPELVLDVPSSVPLVEVSITGLSVCALGEDRSVICASGNAVVPIPMPVTLPE